MSFLRRSLLITLMLLSFTIGVFLTYLVIVNNSVLLEKEIISYIITGLSSLLGGISAGVIAFIVARSQILNERAKEKEKRNAKNLNLIKTLRNETKHNELIHEMILSSDEKKINEYISLLESDVWENIKYEVNTFLPTSLYELIDDQSREYKDIKAGTLTEYKNPWNLDFQVRLETIRKINIRLREIKSNIDDDKSMKKLI